MPIMHAYVWKCLHVPNPKSRPRSTSTAALHLLQATSTFTAALHLLQTTSTGTAALHLMQATSTGAISAGIVSVDTADIIAL
jgi:hypothetical protein